VINTDPATNTDPALPGESWPIRGTTGLATSSVYLIGGGWNLDHLAAVYGGFLDDAAAVAARVGRPGKPVIACVVLDEGEGREQFARWDGALRAVANCEPVPVLITVEAPLDVSDVGNADGLLVCGGLTPAYAEAIAPAATGILDWLLLGDRPYAGFSAGSAVAAASALVGGWLTDGVPVCPDDAAEDLQELSVSPGFGLVQFLVDVHCAQWGTLPRLITAVAAAPDGLGAGIDENTVLVVAPDGRTARVRGAGQVWWVRGTTAGSVAVTAYRDGAEFALH
jgi:cyanophycinase